MKSLHEIYLEHRSKIIYQSEHNQEKAVCDSIEEYINQVINEKVKHNAP